MYERDCAGAVALSDLVEQRTESEILLRIALKRLVLKLLFNYRI